MAKSTNKQEILNRLYAHAVSYWNIDNLESLDPVIKSLIQGLASELFSVANEIENIRVRILNSLADMLTPEDFNSPKCSHAVMQAYPVEPQLHIDKHNPFFIEKIPFDIQKSGVSRIDFTPICQVRLLQAMIPYSIAERAFYKHGKGTEKQQQAYTHVLSEVYNHTIWFALDIQDELPSLRNVTLYIDFPKSNTREAYLSLLPFAVWEIDGQALQVESGLPDWEEEDLSVFQKYDLNHQVDRTIFNYYQKRFQTITSDTATGALKKTRFPDELKELYDPVVYEELEEHLWIKIRLPAGIPASELCNVSLNINAFPVLNKSLYDKTSRQNKLIEIIPLRTDPGETYLSMEQVTDDSGKEYEHIPYTSGTKSVSGTYHLRQGGVERFDDRDAHNIIDYLRDVMRSEISAFSSYGVEYLASTIEELLKGLKLLETKIDDQTITKNRHYLLINTTERIDAVFYSYWGTNCEIANGLGAGQALLPYNSSLISKGSCHLLTRSTGGASAPGATARLDAFRYSLTSRDQINTSVDIVNYCRFELSNKISKVEVRKGVMVSAKPKEGLVRCLDVILWPLSEYREKLTAMKDELRLALEMRSPDSFNYRIIINNS